MAGLVGSLAQPAKIPSSVALLINYGKRFPGGLVSGRRFTAFSIPLRGFASI
jgi:hypothetical protein